MKKSKNTIQSKKQAHLACVQRWCNECRTTVKVCRKNGKQLSECEHIKQLRYKVVVHVPGTKQRITRSAGQNFNEAVKLVSTIRRQIENGEIHEQETKVAVPVNMPQQEATTTTDQKPELLTELFAKYLSQLKGEGVAPHLRVVRSKSHVNDVKNCFKRFCLVVSTTNKLKEFRLLDITDDHIGKFHEYLLSKELSNHFYNRNFSHLTSFANWCDLENYGNAKRFFERVPRKTITPRPEVISRDEFEKLFSVISHANGFQYGIGKHKRTRNHYRDYLIPAFRFALITGRRLEEIITVKFSDITLDDKNRPVYITFTDHKVNRILHIPEGEERELYTPVTKEIIAFLNAHGFDEKKNTDAFILASALIKNRVALMRSTISKGFTHFWRIAFPDSAREVSFKTLRKTYMTAVDIQMRKNSPHLPDKKDTREISGHSSDQVLRHYVDERQVAIADSMKGFSVFGDEGEPKIQRTKPKERGNSIEK